MKGLVLFQDFNRIIAVLFGIFYMYQMVYLAIGLFGKKSEPEKKSAELKRYAVMISARNEENVIGELVESLKHQSYPEDLYEVYVLADNCTDHTADAARKAGAVVYERFNKEKVGKGYALNELYHHIMEDAGTDTYDGFFVFDADNIVDYRFIEEMNRTFVNGKFDAVTGYRNSKNYADNWITAGYSLNFLREARFVNSPRMKIGSSCMVSGTGFLVSAETMKENGGWPFHLLTEDIEFSVDCAIRGKRIGYCDDAIFYDEQPQEFGQSFRQRLRWTKGFFQIAREYSVSLAYSVVKGRENAFDCYDALMTVAPASVLTAFLLIYNTVILGATLFMNPYLGEMYRMTALQYLTGAAVGFYLQFLMTGGFTLIKEWKRIRASSAAKIGYLFLYPFFMFTYVPITLAGIFAKAEWKPIVHHSSRQNRQMKTAE